jgi:hypothetical protein
MKKTIKLIALLVVSMAVSTASAQRIGKNPLAPNANRASDGKTQSQNVQVDQNKVANQTPANTNVSQQDKNSGGVSKPQTINAGSSNNTSIVNPGKNSNSASQPQTINGSPNNSSISKPFPVQGTLKSQTSGSNNTQK